MAHSQNTHTHTLLRLQQRPQLSPLVHREEKSTDVISTQDLAMSCNREREEWQGHGRGRRGRGVQPPPCPLTHGVNDVFQSAVSSVRCKHMIRFASNFQELKGRGDSLGPQPGVMTQRSPSQDTDTEGYTLGPPAAHAQGRENTSTLTSAV